jgi:uncharacterized membrane protein YvbJ
MAAPEICPNCGAEVPPRAKACPECGSDESTGWSTDARAQSLDLPDDNFDYDEFVENEFGKPKKRRISWVWIATAVVLLVIGALLLLKR